MKTLNARIVFCLTLFALCIGTRITTRAEVFRDRAAFEAATQNLQVIDFEDRSENVRATDSSVSVWVKGVRFDSMQGIFIDPRQVVSNRTLLASGVPEISLLNVILPPGITAVAIEQFSRPVEVKAAGHTVTLSASDANNFIGFTSDSPIGFMSFVADFPEPVPSIVVDNLFLGQKRGISLAPILLVTTDTDRAVALDSVAKTGEPFTVAALNTHNLSTDGRARVTLFLAGVGLTADDIPFVSVQAEDSQGRFFDLPVEGVARAKNAQWMAEVVVSLPDQIAGVGDVQLGVTVRGLASNRARINIAANPN